MAGGIPGTLGAPDPSVTEQRRGCPLCALWLHPWLSLLQPQSRGGGQGEGEGGPQVPRRVPASGPRVLLEDGLWLRRRRVPRGGRLTLASGRSQRGAGGPLAGSGGRGAGTGPPSGPEAAGLGGPLGEERLRSGRGGPGSALSRAHCLPAPSRWDPVPLPTPPVRAHAL